MPSLSMRIATERLVLRPPRTNDVSEMRRALRSNTMHLRPWSVAPAPGEDPRVAGLGVARNLAASSGVEARPDFVLVISPRKDNRRVIGRIALGGVLRGAFQNAYLGYWIDQHHQGRGLMTEAVRAATSFAFWSRRRHGAPG